MSSVKEKIEKIKGIIADTALSCGKKPEDVLLIAVTKKKSMETVKEAVQCGAGNFGENYIQEAEEKFNAIGRKVKWHFIGHLQKNKVKKAARIFDMIETVDSVEIAEAINKASAAINKKMPVLIEINSGREKDKSGVFPENAETLIKNLSGFSNIKITGLMTMAPLLKNPEDYRPYFKNTKELFDRIKSAADIEYLSMGMSDSYRIAIQEGANLVRIGTAIFGPR